VLAYAARHPHRVRAVIGVSAPSGTPPEQAAALRERARRALDEGMEAMAELHVATGLPERFRLSQPDAADAYRAVIAAGSREGYAALCGVIAGLDLARELSLIRAPTLLVAGALDAIVPAPAVRATASAIRGATYVELAGCGHVVPVERPAELAGLAAELLGPAR
jgi:pimeloyl-ACP methyl ester carboxylesterase